MKQTDLLELLQKMPKNPEILDIDDKNKVKNTFITLYNIIETLVKIINEQGEEIQRLKDENNRLKGEKGKPKIPANAQPKNDNPPQQKTENWNKGSKNDKITIDREIKVEIEKDKLPSDAVFKGYREISIQNIIVKSNNVLYKLERYYSPSEKKTYEAELPSELKGTQFGPELKAFIMDLYYNARVTEHKIQKILKEHGILISEGQISNILTKEKSEEFSKEKKEIFDAGMASANYFHTDDTGTRHNGINHHVHVFCNALFTVFFIMKKKNNETLRRILGLKENEKLDMAMMTDDAKQFFYLTIIHALCWLHEIRHYKKLDPYLDVHISKVNEFLTKIYDFYEKLKKYTETPSPNEKKILEIEFDRLFTTKTGYWALDQRIELTRAKKDRLLLVLDYPWLPLHNNPAEIALREIVIKRKISYGTKSEYGKTAWENMMSILDTCRKHKVSFYEYVRDILSSKTPKKKLADLIIAGAVSPTTY